MSQAAEADHAQIIVGEEAAPTGSVQLIELAAGGLKLMRGAERTTDAARAEHSERGLTPQQAALYEKYFEYPKSLARKLIRSGSLNPAEYEEAVSDGYFGLVKAVQCFDLSKVAEEAQADGTYIYRCILGEMKRGYRDRNLRRGKIDGVQTAFPKPGVINGSAESLHAPLGDNPDGWTLMDVVIATDQDPADTYSAELDIKQMNLEMQAIIKQLPSREREIIFRYVYLGESQRKVADNIGVSQMQVSRLLRKVAQTIVNELGLQDQYEISMSRGGGGSIEHPAQATF